MNFDSAKALGELKERYNIEFVDSLIKNGFKVYLFGGSLRDMILGKDWKDADIRAAINLSPKERDEKTEKVFVGSNINIDAKIVLADSFTIYRFLPNGSKSSGVIDFTAVTNLSDVPPDFGLNGLFFDLGSKELIDEYGALKDIEEKIIRSVGEPQEKFKNDPIRIFRAIKAACQFGFTVEAQTFQAMKDCSGSLVGTFKSITNDMFPGLTEWTISNVFRGLKYDALTFERLCSDTGVTTVMIKFVAEEIGRKEQFESFQTPAFSEQPKSYEEGISGFLSKVAYSVNSNDAEKIFDKIVEMFRIKNSSEYGDFEINSSEINFFN